MLNECVNFGPVPAAEGADRTAVFPLALQEHLHTGLYLFLFFCVCVHVKDVYAEAFMTFLRFCREKWGGGKKCFILGFHFKTSGQNLQSSQMFSF